MCLLQTYHMMYVMRNIVTVPRRVAKTTIDTAIPMKTELLALLLPVSPIVTVMGEEKLLEPTMVTACT